MSDSRSTERRSARTALALAGVAVMMVGASFAAVPFYDWFCRVTGYGGTVAVNEAGTTGEVLDRTIKVRFDASKEAAMPWKFRPMQTEMDVKIGETYLAFYEAYNPTDHVVAGTAAYNVAPDVAGGYFTKIHCFCFDMQVLQPGERVEMPVTFYVDPSIMDDVDGREIEGITLSYTFYVTDLPEQQAASAPTVPAASAATN